MSEVKISFVVAVYNIEKYIGRCIESLIKQTVDDIEVILVDDCSKDESKSICLEYVNRYPSKIKYIGKSINEGLSEARNTGLKEVTGEYVIFIDGDDFIELNTAEKLIEVIDQYSPEVVIFANQYDLNNGKKIYRLFDDTDSLYENDEIIKKLFPRVIGTLPEAKTDYDVGFAPWARMIRKDVLVNNDILFTSERKLIYEDLIFTLDLFPKLSRVLLLNEAFYHYCENQQSLTKTYDEKKIDRIANMYFYIINNSEYKKLLNPNEIMVRFNRTMISYIRLCLMQTNYKDDNQIKKIICNEMTSQVLKDFPIMKLPLKQRVLTFFVKNEFVCGVQVLLRLYERGNK